MITTADIPDDIRSILGEHFDFSLDESLENSLEFITKPPVDFRIIAWEGAGGLFAQIDNTGEILFVDSEGAGGILADSFHQFLQLLVTHPYWRDLLKFSGGGNLDEMRRCVPWAASEFLEFEPEIGSYIQRVCNRIGVATSDHAIENLHHCVSQSTSRFELIGLDGTPFDTLFNEFVSRHSS